MRWVGCGCHQMHSILHFARCQPTYKDNRYFSSRINGAWRGVEASRLAFATFWTDWLAKRPNSPATQAPNHHSFAFAKLIAARTCVYIAPKKIASDAFGLANKPNSRSSPNNSQTVMKKVSLPRPRPRLRPRPRPRLQLSLAACAMHISWAELCPVPSSGYVRGRVCSSVGLRIVLFGWAAGAASVILLHFMEPFFLVLFLHFIFVFYCLLPFVWFVKLQYAGCLLLLKAVGIVCRPYPPNTPMPILGQPSTAFVRII